MRASVIYRLSAPLTGLLLLLTCAALYRWAPSGYYALLGDLGISPFRHPFLDGEFLPRTVACWRQRIDVYRVNPCDALGRVFNYSPLWLRAGFLADAVSWTDGLGLLTAVGFLLSLLLLPAPQSAWEAVMRTLATVSTMTIYAIERANIDLLLFGLALLAALLLARRDAARPLAYGAILAGGFLKFYPFVLLLLTLRERPRRFLLINGLSAAALVAFCWGYGEELRTLAPHILGGSHFTDLFGAENLPYGLVELVFPAPEGEPGAAWRRALVTALFALLLIDAARRALRLAQDRRFAEAMEALQPADGTLLWTGATLIVACFLAGQNVDYRGIHLLLVLPGVMALGRSGGTARARRLWRWTAVTIVFLMWSEDVRILLDRALALVEAPRRIEIAITGTFWLFRELLWWRLIARLGGVLLWFVRTSEIARRIPGLVRGRRSRGLS